MKDFIKHLWKTSNIQFCIIIALLIFAIFFKISEYQIRPIFDNIIDPTISVITIILAGFIWWNDKKREWLNNLPELLTIAFIYEGKVVAYCENAGLTHESDVRAWSQQTGRQMTGGKNLVFSPYFKHFKNTKPTVLNSKSYIVHYSIFFLDEDPNFDKNAWVYNFNDNKFDKTNVKFIDNPYSLSDIRNIKYKTINPK